jgi:hypothetical protein
VENLRAGKADNAIRKFLDKVIGEERWYTIHIAAALPVPLRSLFYTQRRQYSAITAGVYLSPHHLRLPFSPHFCTHTKQSALTGSA